MAIKTIDTLWDRKTRNDINDNFDTLSRMTIGWRDAINEIVRVQTQNSDLAPEVVDARSGEATLGQKIRTMDAKIVEKASKEQLQSGLEDNKNLLENQLNQIGEMSPSGAFVTLQDLKAAYPNGETGVFVVQADGNWYFWDGASWVVGGSYQATPYAEFMTEENENWVV